MCSHSEKQVVRTHFYVETMDSTDSRKALGHETTLQDITLQWLPSRDSERQHEATLHKGTLPHIKQSNVENQG